MFFVVILLIFLTVIGRYTSYKSNLGWQSDDHWLALSGYLASSPFYTVYIFCI